jgi:hypothetical protein
MRSQLRLRAVAFPRPGLHRKLRYGLSQATDILTAEDRETHRGFESVEQDATVNLHAQAWVAAIYDRSEILTVIRVLERDYQGVHDIVLYEAGL